MRAPTNAASAEERPLKATRSVPPWFEPVGIASPWPRRYARTSGTTSCRPAARFTFAVPPPVAPSAVAGVYVSCAVAAVVPRFASVSSVV